MEPLHPAKQSRRNKLYTQKFLTLLWIGVFWLSVALYQYFDSYATLSIQNCLDADYEHWPYIRGLIASVSIAVVLAGTALVFLWEKWLRNLPFVRVIAYIFLWYVGLFSIITLLTTALFATSDPGVEEQGILTATLAILFDLTVLPNFTFWFFIMLSTMAFLLVRDKFGPRMFGAYLSGKYFRPRREERIFMFMDLKGSTTIAEELGELKYFQFLNDAFRIATPGILNNRGEIYQYVGDEIVVSWQMAAGTIHANCLSCYYEMNRLLEQHSDYFKTTYGVNPIFKAGLHSGFVIAGEMGIIKKEIVYSGDVLNTAARIQSNCNDLDAKMLISKALMMQIDTSELNVPITEVGEVTLKGKANKVELVKFE